MNLKNFATKVTNNTRFLYLGCTRRNEDDSQFLTEDWRFPVPWCSMHGTKVCCINLLERRSRPSRECRKSAALWHTSSVPIWCSQSCKYPDPKLSDLRFLLETKWGTKIRWRQTDFANCFRYWKTHRCCCHQAVESANPKFFSNKDPKILHQTTHSIRVSKNSSSSSKIHKFSIKLCHSEYPKLFQLLKDPRILDQGHVCPRESDKKRRTNDDQRWGHSAFRGICWWKLGRKTVPHRRNALCRQNTRERKAGVFFAAAV